MRSTRRPKLFTPKSSTPTQPIDLPSDLYPLILQHLSKNDLATCLRVCRGFYIEFLPILYREITIDLGKPTNPGLVKRKERAAPISLRKKMKILFKGYGGEEHQTRMKDLTRWEKLQREREIIEMEPGTGFLEGRKTEWLSFILGRPVGYTPPFTIRRLHLTPPTYDYTTHLTLCPHSKRHCLDYKPLIMRNLKTLRLISREGDIHPRPWTCHSRHNHLGACNTDLGCYCPLMAQLRPRRIVIGGFADVRQYDFDLSIATWPALPPDSATWLKEVIIHATGYGMIDFGQNHEGEIRRWDDERDREPPDIKLERLTFILHTENRWRHGHGIGNVEPMPVVDRWNPEMVWKNLAMALEGDIGILEVVGIEWLDSDYPGTRRDCWKLDVAKEEMKKYLVNKGWAEEEANERVENVIFTEEEDYEEEGGFCGRRQIIVWKHEGGL